MRCRGDNGQKQVLGAGTKHAAGSWLHRPHPAPPAPQPPSLCHPDTPSPSSKLFHGQALGAAASLLLPQPAPVPPRVPSKDGAVPAVTASVPPHGTRWQQLPAGAAGGKGLVLAPGRAKPHTRDSVMLLCKLQLQAGCCSGMGFLLHPHPWLGTSCTLDLAGHLLCVPANPKANPKPGTSCTPRPSWAPPAPPDAAGHILHPQTHLGAPGSVRQQACTQASVPVTQGTCNPANISWE